MRIGAEADPDSPVVLGSTIQNGLRAVSLTIIVAITLFAFRTPNGTEPQGSPAAFPEFRIDVNQADLRELTLMPGIGSVTAERILSDRRDHGPFESIEDLSRVPGIGPKTVRSIEPDCQPLQRPGDR